MINIHLRFDARSIDPPVLLDHRPHLSEKVVEELKRLPSSVQPRVSVAVLITSAG